MASLFQNLHRKKKDLAKKKLLKKKNKFEYWNQAIIIKKMLYGMKDWPWYQKNRIESLEIDLYLYGQVAQVIQWRKLSWNN